MIKKIILNLCDRSFFLFLCIGGLNTFLAMGIMFVLYNFVGFGYWGSSVTAFIICSIISYILNRRISFKSNAPVFSSAFKFSIVIALCYTISFGISKPMMFWFFKTFNIGVSYAIIEQLAMLMAQGIFTIMNFLGQKLWVFRS